MHKTSVLLLLLLPALFGSVNAQKAEEDWSLKNECTIKKGRFTPRDKVTRPGIGDVCTKIEVRKATDSELHAEDECQKEYPYHVTKAYPGRQTICDLETGLICKAGWKQIYGRCYKMTAKRMKRQAAEQHCASENARIAMLHRPASAEHYYKMNTGLNQIWVEASDAKKKDVLYRKGKDLMLVFDGHGYRVRNLAIILVDGTKDKAHVLCEYTPPMTWEESSYLIRKYAQIYFKGFTNEEGMFMRTANQMTLNEQDYRDDEKYCQNVMKPFISPDANRFSGAYPSKMFLKGLDAVKDKTSVNFVRTPARFEAGGEFRRNRAMCNAEQPRNIKDGYFIELRKPDISNRKTHINDIWKPNQPVLKCDGGSWSTAIRTVPNKPVEGMETMSDARRAPMYCQVRFTNTRYGPCPDGWVSFKRPSGMKWCHLHHHTTDMNEADSKQFCKNEGAFLDGYENADEYAVMKKMVHQKVTKFKWETRINGKCWRNRLGGHRRKECTTGIWDQKPGQTKQNPQINGYKYGYHPAPENICSRRNVFQWENNVASEPPSIVDDNWNVEHDNFPNPSYRRRGRDEQCLELLSDGDMNDFGCDGTTCFFCGKEARIIRDD